MRNITITVNNLDGDARNMAKSVKWFFDELNTDGKLEQYFTAYTQAVTGDEGLSFQIKALGRTCLVTIND